VARFPGDLALIEFFLSLPNDLREHLRSIQTPRKTSIAWRQTWAKYGRRLDLILPHTIVGGRHGLVEWLGDAAEVRTQKTVGDLLEIFSYMKRNT